MKKIFTILMAMLLSVGAFAALNYGAVLTQADFNNNQTVISKIIPSGSEVVWDNGQIRCGGSSTKITEGPAWNWDDKGVVIALAAGVPNQLTFQYATNNGASTKGSTDWTAPDWYVDESADGSQWTNAWTTNSNSTSFSSQTVNLKTGTRYIRMYFSGNFAGYFKNIKVTEQVLLGEPSANTLDFGTVKVDDAVEAKTFTINYTGMEPTASSSDAHFTVSPESFGSLYDYKVTQTISVGMQTNEAGEYSGTVTVEGRGKSAQVTVSGKVEKYNQTINWDAVEEYNYGDAIPAATATSGLEVSYEFSNPSVLKFENGAFVTLYAGKVTVTAKQAGNYKYNAAENVEKTITVTAPNTYGKFEKKTCDESVTFNKQTYEESFTGDVTVGKNYMGGDSIVHVAITINHASTSKESLTITYGDRASWNGAALSDSTVGVHIMYFTTENAVGCDSTVILTLTVTKQPTLEVPVALEFCEGGSVDYRDKTYTEAGKDQIEAVGEIRDTLYMVTITELKKSYIDESMTIEQGEEKTWNGYDLSTYAVDTYDLPYTTTNVAGCDSTITLHLTVTKQGTVIVPVELSFCEGGSVDYRDKTYIEAGTDRIEAVGDISDTVYTVTITELKKSYVNESMTIEVGEEKTWNGYDLSIYAVDTYDLPYTTTNVAGCDSTITLHLTVNKLKTLNVEYPIEFCEGDSVQYRGEWYVEAGEFQVYAEGEVRDTVINVIVTVHEKAYAEIERSVLAGDVLALPEGEWTIGDQVVSGVYETQRGDTLGLELYQYDETEFGCESVVKLIVTVTPNYEAIENVFVDEKAAKFFRNGVLYIRRGESVYTATGERVE